VGGAIGILAGPLAIVAGAGIGALAAKLHDSGFNDGQLEALGRTLGPGHSAVICELATDAVETAKALAAALGSTQSVEVALESSVADLFADDEAPVPETAPAAEAETDVAGCSVDPGVTCRILRVLLSAA